MSHKLLKYIGPSSRETFLNFAIQLNSSAKVYQLINKPFTIV